MYNCGLGFIFYGCSVVGGVVNCLNDIYGGGIHRTRRYRCDCVGIQFIKICTPYVEVGIRCDDRNNDVLPQKAYRRKDGWRRFEKHISK